MSLNILDFKPISGVQAWMAYGILVVAMLVSYICLRLIGLHGWQAFGATVLFWLWLFAQAFIMEVLWI